MNNKSTFESPLQKISAKIKREFEIATNEPKKNKIRLNIGRDIVSAYVNNSTPDLILTTFTEVFLFKKEELDINFFMDDRDIKNKVKKYMQKNFSIRLDVSEMEITKDSVKRIISIYPCCNPDNGDWN